MALGMKMEYIMLMLKRCILHVGFYHKEKHSVFLCHVISIEMHLSPNYIVGTNANLSALAFGANR